MPGSNHAYRLIRDETGLVVAAVDAAGQVVWQGSYDPYGRLTGTVTGSTGPIGVPMRFAGQWFDVDAQLVYNHHRWYDARVGRYLRPDPLFEQGQWQDPYMYVQGNPYTFSDPLGLWEVVKRELTPLEWVPGDYSYGSSGAENNTGRWHEAIKLDNGFVVGYDSEDGVSAKDTGASHEWTSNDGRSGTDDDLMRNVMNALREGGRWNPDGVGGSDDDYDLFGHNCQDFVDAAIALYNHMQKLRQNCD